MIKHTHKHDSNEKVERFHSENKSNEAKKKEFKKAVISKDFTFCLSNEEHEESDNDSNSKAVFDLTPDSKIRG